MNDLISRSEVLELLYKIFDKYYMSTDKNPSIISKSFGTESFGIDVFKEIKKMPTAYSVDRVVKELNKLDVKAIKRYKGGTFGDYEGTDYYIKKSDAIEIVKQGGISDASDNVCEWRLCDEEANVYDTSCRNPHILIEGTPKENNYEYCPYCGKKIKVVE